MQNMSQNRQCEDSLIKIAQLNRNIIERFNAQDHPKRFNNMQINKDINQNYMRENNKLLYAYDIKNNTILNVPAGHAGHSVDNERNSEFASSYFHYNQNTIKQQRTLNEVLGYT